MRNSRPTVVNAGKGKRNATMFTPEHSGWSANDTVSFVGLPESLVAPLRSKLTAQHQDHALKKVLRYLVKNRTLRHYNATDVLGRPVRVNLCWNGDGSLIEIATHSGYETSTALDAIVLCSTETH